MQIKYSAHSLAHTKLWQRSSKYARSVYTTHRIVCVCCMLCCAVYMLTSSFCCWNEVRDSFHIENNVFCFMYKKSENVIKSIYLLNFFMFSRRCFVCMRAVKSNKKRKKGERERLCVYTHRDVIDAINRYEIWPHLNRMNSQFLMG